MPPPEPTSTIGPVEARARARPRAARRRAAPGAPRRGRGARSGPGWRARASSQRSSAAHGRRDRRRRSGSARCPRSSSPRPGSSFSRRCTTLRSTAVIGSSSTALAGVERPLRGPQRERVEGRLAAGPVAGGVDDDLLPVVGLRARDDRVREVLDRVDRLAVLADEQPEVAARCTWRRPRPSSSCTSIRHGTPSPSTIRSSTSRASVGDRSLRVGAPATGATPSSRRDARDHARRRVADSEQPALALGDDLELDRRLVEPGMQPLELAQRASTSPRRRSRPSPRRLAAPRVTAAPASSSA